MSQMPQKMTQKQNFQGNLDCQKYNLKILEEPQLNLRREAWMFHFPSKVIKKHSDTFINGLLSRSNNSVTKSEFPTFFEIVDIAPVFKKGQRREK